MPGYNFPRLPLLAFVPARREKVGRDSFLSRPRFLALSEFGPRSIIYHEGSQYRVTKAILNIRDEDSVSVETKLPVREARLCPACGYGHFGTETEAERCIYCHAAARRWPAPEDALSGYPALSVAQAAAVPLLMALRQRALATRPPVLVDGQSR